MNKLVEMIKFCYEDYKSSYMQPNEKIDSLTALFKGKDVPYRVFDAYGSMIWKFKEFVKKNEDLNLDDECRFVEACCVQKFIKENGYEMRQAFTNLKTLIRVLKRLKERLLPLSVQTDLLNEYQTTGIIYHFDKVAEVFKNVCVDEFHSYFVEKDTVKKELGILLLLMNNEKDGISELFKICKEKNKDNDSLQKAVPSNAKILDSILLLDKEWNLDFFYQEEFFSTLEDYVPLVFKSLKSIESLG